MPMNDSPALRRKKGTSKKTGRKKASSKKVGTRKASVRASRKREGKPEEEVHSEDEQGRPEVFDEQPCNIGFSLARTVNVAKYESVKVEVSIHSPCAAGEVDECLDEEFEWASGKLTEVLKRLDIDLDD